MTLFSHHWKDWKKPCSIRKQTLQWFQNVTPTTWPATGVATSMHCKGFVETWHTFEVPTSCSRFLFSASSMYVYHYFNTKSDCGRWEKNLLDIQVSVCYILKHLEDRKALSVHIYCIWCDILLFFKLHKLPIHSLKIRVTSHLCNKYEQIVLSYLLCVNYYNGNSIVQ